MRVVLMGMVLALLAACGGGGGSGGGTTAGENAVLGGTSSGAAVAIDVAAVAPSAQTVIHGMELTLILPAGVTVAADPATGIVPPENFQAPKVALSMARYIPATATAPASLEVRLADAAGFLPGAVATVICSDASGGNLSASAIGVADFNSTDRDGNHLAEVSWQLAVRKL